MRPFASSVSQTCRKFERIQLAQVAGILGLVSFAFAPGILFAPDAPPPQSTPPAPPSPLSSTAFATDAAGPAWWATQGVLSEDAAARDFAVINQGQLKNLALKAALAMEASLPDGAGAEVLGMVAAWFRPAGLESGDLVPPLYGIPAADVVRDENAPVTIGQLKAVALPFYRRLEAVGILTAADFPWAQNTRAAFHTGAANIGQAKNLFAFQLPAAAALADSDGDGIPDAWERILGFNPLNADADWESFPGSGRSRADRYAAVLALLAPASASAPAAVGAPAAPEPIAADAARPFYAVVDLGPTGSGDASLRATLSARNAWLLHGGRRWSNGVEQDVFFLADRSFYYLRIVNDNSTTADIRSDGAVLINTAEANSCGYTQNAVLCGSDTWDSGHLVFAYHTNVARFLHRDRILCTLTHPRMEVYDYTYPTTAVTSISYSIAGTLSTLALESPPQLYDHSVFENPAVQWRIHDNRHAAYNGDILAYHNGEPYHILEGRYPFPNAHLAGYPQVEQHYPGLILTNLNSEHITVGRDLATNAPVFTFARQRFFLPPPLLPPLAWKDTSCTPVLPLVSDPPPPPLPDAVQTAPLLINSPHAGTARAGFHTITDGRNLWFRKATPHGRPASIPHNRPGFPQTPPGLPDYADPVPVDICVDAALEDIAISALNDDGLLYATARAADARTHHLLLIPAERVSGIPCTPAERVAAHDAARIREHPGLTPEQIAAAATASPAALALLLRDQPQPVTLRFPAFAETDAGASNYRLRAGNREYPLRRFPGRDPITGTTRDYFYPVEPDTPWENSPKFFLPAAAGASLGPRFDAPGYDPDTGIFRVHLIVRNPDTGVIGGLSPTSDADVEDNNGGYGDGGDENGDGNGGDENSDGDEGDVGDSGSGGASYDPDLLGGGAAWGYNGTPAAPATFSVANANAEIPNPNSGIEATRASTLIETHSFFTVIDLGQTEGESSKGIVAISEKNGWLVTDDYRRWSAGGWQRLERHAYTSNFDEVDMYREGYVMDIANDGSVFAADNGDDTYPIDTFFPGLSTGFFWRADVSLAPMPSIPSFGLSGDEARGLSETRSWGLKVLENSSLVRQCSTSGYRTNEEWMDGSVRYGGSTYVIGILNDNHPQPMLYRNIGRHIGYTPTWINRRGYLLYQKGDHSGQPSNVMAEWITNHSVVVPPDAPPFATSKTGLTFYAGRMRCLNREGMVTGIDDDGALLPAWGENGKLSRLPRCAYEKECPFTMPQLINSPTGPRTGYHVIASDDHLWFRRAHLVNGKIDVKKEFHPAVPLTKLMEPDNGWVPFASRWTITAINDDGLIGASGSKSDTGAWNLALLVPSNFVKFTPTTSAPQTSENSPAEFEVSKIWHATEMQHPEINDLSDRELDGMEPYSFRFAVVDGWENNPRVQLVAGTAYYRLKKFSFKNAVTKEMEEHLYPVEKQTDAYPKCFIFSKIDVEGEYHTPGYTGGSGEYTFKLYANLTENIALKIKVIPEPMSVDADRNGRINDADLGLPTCEDPWRFWINEDNDDGDVNNSKDNHDILARDTDGIRDKIVNGRSDLADFFPVWLDLKKIKERFPRTTESGYDYYLRNEGGTLNFGILNLSKSQSSLYLKQDTRGWEDGTKAHKLPLRRVTHDGTLFPQRGNDPDGLFLIVEGLQRADKNNKKISITTPLVFQVRKNNVVVYEHKLPLSLSPVRDMYRWINLRDSMGGNIIDGTDISEPKNYPDRLTNDKHFVFTHGFNVSERNARAWGAEVFKRLYLSGSRAKFSMVTWYSDWFAPQDYWANVVLAFRTAPFLVNNVRLLPGREIHIAAHSLGNMLVSSAIKDHGLNAKKYFMLNAAVPREAFSPLDVDMTRMRHPAWAGYSTRLWASNWWQLFPEEDARHKLTWRNRFLGMSPGHNFYSTGEEVLDYMDGLTVVTTGERSWVWQEKQKGGRLSSAYKYRGGGWDFSLDHNTPSNTTFPMPPERANQLPDFALRLKPFFTPFAGNFHGNQPNVNVTDGQRDQLLACAIPALSIAAGRERITAFGDDNTDMNKEFLKDWPAKRISDPKQRKGWLHSDAKDVAYFYTYRLYDKWVEIGNLNQKKTSP